MLLIKFFIDGTSTSQNKHCIHTWSNLNLIVIECIKLNNTIFLYFCNDYTFFITHNKISINKVAGNFVDRLFLEWTNSTSFEVYIKSIT